MKTSKLRMWLGLLAPLWVFVGFVVLWSCRSSGNKILDFFVLFGLWWGIALLLAVSGVRSGYLGGILAGALTILGFIGFVLVLLNGGFPD
jgi:hypothetical protein